MESEYEKIMADVKRKARFDGDYYKLLVEELIIACWDTDVGSIQELTKTITQFIKDKDQS